MDRLQETTDRLVDFSSALLDIVLRLKDLVEPKPDSWRGFVAISPPIQPSVQEIYGQRQEALERNRQQYELEHGDDVL